MPHHSPPIEIGITGGIGSGKSTVCKLLHQHLGASLSTVIDADATARAVTATGGAAIPALRQAFGAQAIASDGSLNRDFMRTLLTSNPEAKAQLEAITHPLIRQAMDDSIQNTQTPLVLLDVPLLVESGDAWLGRVQHVCVVDCTTNTQTQRTLSRSSSRHWSAEQVARVIAMQASRTARHYVADTIIFNGDHISLDALSAQCAVLAQEWQRHLLPHTS